MAFLNLLFTLLTFATIALARALPYNTSSDSFGGHAQSIPSSDLLVHTAAAWDPNNIASDTQWDKYQKKGDHYQCLFEASDEGAGFLVEDTRTPPSAQSVWKGSMVAERKTWNWHENHFDEENCDIEYIGLKEAFDALKLSTECEDDGGHNVGWSLGHYDESRVHESDPNSWNWQMIEPVDQTYVVDGKTYKSTGGYFTFIVNHIDGAILALDLSSPQSAVKIHWRSIGGTATEADLPKLRYMSDLVWGKWVEGNANIKNLRVYAVNYVLNDETTAIVARAMRNKGVSNLALWPGSVFDKNNDPIEFQALIGSPIGGAMSIMLAQHKQELGNKEIFQVNVVTDSKSLQHGRRMEMHLLFQIRDVPSSKSEVNKKRVNAGSSSFFNSN